MEPIDVSRVTTEAQSVVEQAAAIYLRHTQPWFVGLLIHGSALKGGFIPGCSDVDLHLYLEEQAFTADGQLPLDLCLAIHRDLATVDPAPFRYLECVALSRTLPPDYTGPIPGAYHMLAGTLPVSEATHQQLRDAARKALAALKPVPSFISHALLERGGGRLASCVRLLCTDVWSTLYHVLALQHDDAIGVWNLPKEGAIALVPPDTPVGREIRAFYRAVWAYYPPEQSVEHALAVIAMGVAFLRAAESWWEDARVQ
jgi:hypothetical protein